METHCILTAETDNKLPSYSGHPINCYGSINLKLSKGNEEYQPHKFYVVEVPGPAIYFGSTIMQGSEGDRIGS